MRRVHFEDKGQDFLRFDIDKDGKIVDCQPFQASIWCGLYAIGLDTIRLGDRLSIRFEDGEEMSIRYTIVNVEDL